MTAITRSHVARYVQDLEDTWAFRLKIAAEHERDELRVRYGQQRARVRTTLLAAVLGMTDLRQLLHDPDGVVIATTDDGSLIWTRWWMSTPSHASTSVPVRGSSATTRRSRTWPP